MMNFYSIFLFSLFLFSLCNTSWASDPNPNRFFVSSYEWKTLEMEKLVAVNGGKIVTRLKIGEKNVHVVELPETADGKSFKSRMNREGFVCKVDHPRYSYPTIEEFSGTRMLQSGKIPWGIANVFDSNLPSKDYLPDMVTHSICIVDSGYQMNHPDLPNATNADPNQGSSFSSDECKHGEYRIIVNNEIGSWTLLEKNGLTKSLDQSIHRRTATFNPY